MSISDTPKTSNNNNVMENSESLSNHSASLVMTFRLNWIFMEVHHVEIEDKAIRKAQRDLTRANNHGNSEEIKEAEAILEEAILKKKKASEWMYPNQTIDKLSHILNQQIENEEDIDIIE